jgi:hypothetical protein
MTEAPEHPATKEEPFIVESETVDAIRARAPLEAIILDFMLIDGRAVMADMTPEEVREGIRARYEVDPYEVASRTWAPHDNASTLPYIAGIYSSADVAKVVACRLIDAGLPILVERLPEAPPNAQVIETLEGRVVHGHKGPVWVIRTGYSASDTNHQPG